MQVATGIQAEVLRRWALWVPEGQTSNKDQEVCWGEGMYAQGRAESKGSSNISEAL